MRFVAQMRAAADRNQMGFIGGYMDEATGEIYMQTNFDDPEMEEAAKNMVKAQLPQLED